MDKNKIFLVLVALLTSTGIYQVTSQSNPVFDGALNQLHPAIIYQEFTNYMLKYNKVYTPSERSYRLDIFAHSYWFVMSQNAKKSTWKAALNKYSDMTQEEIKIKVLIEYPEEPKAPSKKLVEKIYNTDPPAEKNWVTDGAVTSVKDEGSCGSGYAFGAVEPYESAHYLMYKELVSFSAQQIVDCSKAYGNKGCNGGGVENAYNYIKDLSDPTKGFEGITTDIWYPYTAMAGSCQYDESLPSYQLFDYLQFPDNQEVIKKFVGLEAPVSAGVYFEPMIHYSSGVWTDDDNKCGRNKADKALTIVGYGVDNSGSNPVSYWLCKNFFGKDWGEQGYIRIVRQETGRGVCQITRYCLAPEAF